MSWTGIAPEKICTDSSNGILVALVNFGFGEKYYPIYTFGGIPNSVPTDWFICMQIPKYVLSVPSGYTLSSYFDLKSQTTILLVNGSPIYVYGLNEGVFTGTTVSGESPKLLGVNGNLLNPQSLTIGAVSCSKNNLIIPVIIIPLVATQNYIKFKNPDNYREFIKFYKFKEEYMLNNPNTKSNDLRIWKRYIKK